MKQEIHLKWPKPKSQKMYQVPQIIVTLRYMLPFTYCAGFSFSLTVALGLFASALVQLLLWGGGLLLVMHSCICYNKVCSEQ